MPTPIESGSGKSGNYLQSIPGLKQFSAAPTPSPPPIGSGYKAIEYVGDGASSRALTAIDMSVGGMIIIRKPTGGDSRAFLSTNGSNPVSTDWATSGANTSTAAIAFTSTGAVLTSSAYNANGVAYKAWFFQKNPSFFDVVKYTGDGTTDQVIPHSLACPVGRIGTRNIDGVTTSSITYIYDINAGNQSNGGLLGSAAFATGDVHIWASTTPTTSVFHVGGVSQTNALGVPYVAFLFAHDTSPAGVIQCVTWVGNTSTSGPVVLPGWQPQLLFTKCMSLGSSQWLLFDTLTNPGFAGATPHVYIADTFPNDSTWDHQPILLVPGGFQLTSASLDINQGNYTAVVIRSS